jgi:hypothetical protein
MLYVNNIVLKLFTLFGASEIISISPIFVANVTHQHKIMHIPSQRICNAYVFLFQQVYIVELKTASISLCKFNGGL